MALRAMEGKKEEPEIINVWELMSGLDDAESSPREMPFPAIPMSKQMAISPDLAAKLSLDSFTLEPSNERARHPQKPFFPKVERRYARSSVLVLEDPVTPLPAPPPIKLNPVDTPSSKGSSLFGSVSGSNTSSFEALADNLQRSLSFKLVFNNQNKGILGIEDTLFSNSSKDECANDVVEDLVPIRRSSESDSMPTTPSSNAVFSTSSKLKKWFKVNKGALKLQNAVRGGSKQEGYPKKMSMHSNVPPGLSSGDAITGGLNKKVSESGSSSKVSESSSSRRGSDDFPEFNGESARITASAEQNKALQVGQGGPVHRYRHSFSSGNQNRGSAEEGVPTSMYRPSSWELEKVVTDSGFKAVLYSTNLRTDINAYEDSNAVRAILISLVGAAFDEKCVSQNLEYERELKNALNLPVVAVPTICVRGKYIAGIDNIMQFFKKGILGSLLLETLPHGLKPNSTCLCKGGKFLICPICKGKRKIIRQGEDPASCRHCIGTGLLKCPGCPK
ncbi:hypothetical protein GOP47_0024198 [Adiantum capillus-veneris]|uniref:Glutaredoxin domain-containing protein n=1 Tax=Adiantum capillus-veneris TaxID=13818 RepID=A0A9D4U567_ADICA|nr:hypothetical protein GOP47_0024198 [Adiantum capillus-veneris]